METKRVIHFTTPSYGSASCIYPMYKKWLLGRFFLSQTKKWIRLSSHPNYVAFLKDLRFENEIKFRSQP